MGKHNFLFVVPSYYNDNENRTQQRRCIPYGVLSIVTYIEAECDSISCDVLDLNLCNSEEEEWEQLELFIRSKDYSLVGFSMMYGKVESKTAELSEWIRRNSKTEYIVAGGIYASTMAARILEMIPCIDAVCYGEGELPYKKLVLSGNYKEAFESIPSWITRKKVMKNFIPEALWIDDLDEIPLIRYDKVNIEQYGSRIQTRGKIQENSLPIHTTRGCPYKCTFCCASKNHGHRIRYMSAKRVINDIAQMKQLYGINKISIDDDQFLFLEQRAEEILEGISEYNLKLEFASGINVSHINPLIAHGLKKAGADSVVIAIESGSQEVLDKLMHKPVRISEVDKVIDELHKNDLMVYAFIMIGMPGETDEDRNKTREFLKNSKIDWCIFNVVQPYRGSSMYEECKKRGILKTITTSGIDYEIIEPYDGFHKEMLDLRYDLKLDINYINNWNLRNFNYEKALSLFKTQADQSIHHPISQYCTALALTGMGKYDEAECYFQRYLDALRYRSKWINVVQKYDLVMDYEMLRRKVKYL